VTIRIDKEIGRLQIPVNDVGGVEEVEGAKLIVKHGHDVLFLDLSVRNRC